MAPTVELLRGGAPVNARILINVDPETVSGDGSRDRPLVALGSNVQTVERVEVTEANSESNVIDPDKTITYVEWTAATPGGETSVPLDMASPGEETPVGYLKEIVFMPAANITWRVRPSPSGIEAVRFTQGDAGGVIFMWTGTQWVTMSTQGGTILT